MEYQLPHHWNSARILLYMGIVQYSSSEMPAGHRAGPYSMGVPLTMDNIQVLLNNIHETELKAIDFSADMW